MQALRIAGPAVGERPTVSPGHFNNARFSNGSSMNPTMGRSEKLSSPNQQRPERRTVPGLAAYHWTGSAPQQNSIRDISSTGVYLLTKERWAPGALVSLTLQMIGPPEKSPERRIAVQARAIRWGEDGVGLSFVLPPGTDLRLWESRLKSKDDLTDPSDVLREFHVAGALAFLRRISPDAGEDVARLFREGLSNYRVESAVEIAAKAEKLLASAPAAARMRARSDLVMRILEDGSWAEGDWMQQMWAGLLATGCTPEGNDDSNMIFANLLSQLTPIHVRMLATACSKGVQGFSGIGRPSSRAFACTAEEMMKATGSRELLKLDRDLEHLSDLGLLEKRVKSSRFTPVEDANITPTVLGQNMYSRCSGHRAGTTEFVEVSQATPFFANEA